MHLITIFLFMKGERYFAPTYATACHVANTPRLAYRQARMTQ